MLLQNVNAEARQDTEHIMEMTRKVILQKEVYSKQKEQV